MKEWKLAAKLDNLDAVLAFVDGALEEADCSVRARMQIAVAVEEVFVNIASYAYAPGEGEATIRLEVSEEPAEATLTFVDSGVPFDPLAKEDPDLTLDADQRPIGGLGIFMTKKLMDGLDYAYRDGQNVLTIRKRI